MDVVGTATAGSGQVAASYLTVPQKAALQAAKTTAPAPSDPAASRAIAARVDPVEISGQSMMLSRLYHGTIVSYTPGNAPASGTVYGFLTATDRDTLANLYEYTQAHGMDPVEVDHLAFDLGIYRSEPPGVVKLDDPGAAYDADGNLMPIAFSGDDEATARRILTSKAVKDSALPEDFLRDELTPLTGTDKATDFAFLEKIVYATSTSGSDGSTDPDAVLAPRSAEYFRSLQLSKGEILTPEQVKRLAAGRPADAPSFEDYADRVQGLAGFLRDEDKNVLASLYDTVARQYGPTSPHMKSVDQFARTLATLRLLSATTAGSDQRITAWTALVGSSRQPVT
jgi:hypothetical protein